jgi:hypothetical protein
LQQATVCLSHAVICLQNKQFSKQLPLPWSQATLDQLKTELQASIQALQNHLETSLNTLQTNLEQRMDGFDQKLTSIERTSAVVNRSPLTLFF